MKPRSIALALLLLPALCQAAPWGLVYSGTVVSSSGTGDVPAVGSSMSGAIVFDSDTDEYTPEAPVPGFPGYAGYSLAGPPYFTSIDAPPRTLFTPLLSVEVYDNDLSLLGISEPGDMVTIGGKRDAVSFILLLRGPTSSFSGTLIPNPSVLSSFWDSASVFSFGGMSFDSRFRADLSALTVSPVPEPSTAMLLLSGVMLGLYAARRRA